MASADVITPRRSSTFEHAPMLSRASSTAAPLQTSLNLAEVLHETALNVQQLLNVERCTVFCVDPETQELVSYRGASSGRSDASALPFLADVDEFRLPLSGKGLACHVARSGETLVIQDVAKDARFDAVTDSRSSIVTHNMLICPMKVRAAAVSGEDRAGVDNDDPDHSGKGNVIVGVVQAMNKFPLDTEFSAEDMNMISAYSERAAVAVANSRLFDNASTTLRETQALADISNTLSSELQLKPLIQKIVRKVQSLLEAERCTLFIVQGEDLISSSQLSAGVGSELPIEHGKRDSIQFPKFQGLAGAAVLSKKFMHICDAYADKRFNKDVDKRTGFVTRNMLIVPIIDKKDDVVAVAQVINKQGGRQFTNADERMLKAFAAQIGVGITNSKLFEKTEKALNQVLLEVRNLKFMLSITRDLSSQNQSAAMLVKMIPQLETLLGADHSMIFLRQGDQFYNVRHPKTKFNIARGLVGTSIRSMKSVVVSGDVRGDFRFDDDFDCEGDYDIHSLLVVPIIAEKLDEDSDDDDDDDDDDEEEKAKKKKEKEEQGDVPQTEAVGAILVQDEKQGACFGVEEDTLLQRFCAQAAIAVATTRHIAHVTDTEGIRPTNTDAAEYLKSMRGMKLNVEAISSFSYSVNDIKLLESIGTGSFGEVFRGRVGTVSKDVAIKRLYAQNLKRDHLEAFCSEASLMMQLEHENIVGFIGACTDPANFCIITEYCARGSLVDIIMSSKSLLTDKRKIQILRDAALGLDYLHSSNPPILHRDLKSDNILLTADWSVKVGDFGLTRFHDETKRMTQVGTPMWMAPEVIVGKNYTEKADVYSYGIIMWEVLTGKEPYEDKEIMQVVVEVVNKNLRPEIPAECANHPMVPLMKECWHITPGERPTFSKIYERLDEIYGKL